MATATLPSRAAPGTRGSRGLPGVATVLAGGFLGLVAVAALHPGLLTAASPADIDPLAALAPPGPRHWFGTDELGRDVYTRVVHAARSSLVIGLGATAIGVGLGALLGFAAALLGRLADQVLMRLVDALLAFPAMLLALLAIIVLGPGTGNVVVAVGIAVVPDYARLVRSRALVVRGADYVAAATVLGVPQRRVLRSHVMPNALWPLLVRVTLGVGSAILAGAALSFLGLGPAPPAVEWGAMVADGQEFLARAWWVVLAPGAAITATVVALTVLGRAVQARWEGVSGA